MKLQKKAGERKQAAALSYKDLKEWVLSVAQASARKQKKIRPSCLVVANGLALGFANLETGLCCPGLPAIAEITGLPRSTVIEALQQLKDAGFLTWKRRGRNGSNNYTFTRGSPAHKTPMEELGSPVDRTSGSPVDRTLTVKGNCEGAVSAHVSSLETPPAHPSGGWDRPSLREEQSHLDDYRSGAHERGHDEEIAIAMDVDAREELRARFGGMIRHKWWAVIEYEEGRMTWHELVEHIEGADYDQAHEIAV